tara:strand:- start:1244 stop:1387 length:144 start_codon:yes stop_codon:yes gene_type:complete
MVLRKSWRFLEYDWAAKHGSWLKELQNTSEELGGGGLGVFLSGMEWL